MMGGDARAMIPPARIAGSWQVAHQVNKKGLTHISSFSLRRQRLALHELAEASRFWRTNVYKPAIPSSFQGSRDMSCTEGSGAPTGRPDKGTKWEQIKEHAKDFIEASPEEHVK
jgi:hypothetical protein